MNYRFILTYKPTDSETTSTRTCFPLHGDDLAISIDRESDEWYYTRKLDGNLTFVRDDYAWMMACPFDGTFTLDIKESHDNGANWFDYFTGTFSRANLEIDQDNQTATLNGLSEGIPDLIKNGAKEEYDLMKLIPDSEAKEVQGQMPPALAMVDYNTTKITKSAVFCGGAITAGGYKDDADSGFNETARILLADPKWHLQQAWAEAKITQPTNLNTDSIFAGTITYNPNYPPSEYGTWPHVIIQGNLYNKDGWRLNIVINMDYSFALRQQAKLYNNSSSTNPVADSGIQFIDYTDTGYYTPISRVIYSFPSANNHVDILFHYIRSTLLTQSPDGVQSNILDTGDYYKGMSAFEGSGLYIYPSANTSEQPNGHRMVPGSDEQGGTPQYFAPPDDNRDYIPLLEDQWNNASVWYTIDPSPANGLTDPEKYGTFRWTRCWNIGTCIRYLLDRITNGQVVFAETTDYSQFLYGNPNPVEGHEPFQWLVTQKSNVMNPAASGAARCVVRLEWFFELLRNAFNCYYWLERRNDGRYDFRIEHVEYFRCGGAYQGDLADQLDLTRLKPYRNFLRNNMPAKRYADQTNKYTFDLEGMVEKYTYSWQGEGGSDDFKGNPMYFRAGWIEKGTSEDHQVDNIFADLGWLMLNAGTDTESSRNYDGLFIFGGYRPFDITQWKENEAPMEQYLNNPSFANLSAWVTIGAGYTVTVEKYNTQTHEVETIATYLGEDEPQLIQMTFTQGQRNILPRINFGVRYDHQIIHRVHNDMPGNVYRVPNVENMLRDNNYLQNGVLAWPWLQKEYLHYDIPAAKWTYLKDDYTDNPNLVWESDGTIKMVKKQSLAVVPVPDASTEKAIMDIMGIKTGLGIGIIDNAKINLSSRNAEMTIIYDINPQNN